MEALIHRRKREGRAGGQIEGFGCGGARSDQGWDREEGTGSRDISEVGMKTIPSKGLDKAVSGMVVSRNHLSFVILVF